MCAKLRHFLIYLPAIASFESFLPALMECHLLEGCVSLTYPVHFCIPRPQCGTIVFRLLTWIKGLPKLMTAVKCVNYAPYKA